MKTNNNILVSIFMLFLLFSSCKKTECKINNAPTSPNILTGDVDATGAILKWSASTDSEGDAVVYDVYLIDATHPNKFSVATNVNATTFKYVTAEYPTVVVVVAKDGKGGEATGIGKFTFFL